MIAKTITTQIQDVPPATGEEGPNPLLELKKAEEQCRECHPLTPMTCMTRCNVWKLKNEFRKHYEKMNKNDYTTELLNTLKNKRRLEILNILSKYPTSLVQLQQNLKKLGCYHSQQTIVKEYIEPLIETGLIEKAANTYYATTFGCRINELLKDFHNIEKVLLPHSRCY